MANPGVNLRVYRREFAAQAPRIVTPRMNRVLDADFEARKQTLLRAFDNHDVTKEIVAGPTASSKYIDDGNLNSLLGFGQQEGPVAVDALRDYLEESVKLSPAARSRMVGNSFIVERTGITPSNDSVYENTTGFLEWVTRSWVDLIQRGVTGFSAYIYRPNGFNSPEPSRSGSGIEATNSKTGKTINYRGGSMKPIPYINELLAKFRNSLRRTTK